MPKLPSNGIYAITPENLAGEPLWSAVRQSLAGGVGMVQYRNKSLDHDTRRVDASALMALCAEFDATFIINDDIELAIDVNADGVHVGKDDAALDLARQSLGSDCVIGVSCYNEFERAQVASRGGADYVAFGSFYPSSTKPNAVRASTDLLERARDELGIPVVAIGGIEIGNAEPLVRAGASFLAIVTAIYSAPDIANAASELSRLYP